MFTTSCVAKCPSEIHLTAGSNIKPVEWRFTENPPLGHFPMLKQSPAEANGTCCP